MSETRWWKRKSAPTESELWGQTLPPTPLNRHLVSLHALLLHLGAEGNFRAVGEHSLREIAVFTRLEPRYYAPPADHAAKGGDETNAEEASA